MPVLLTSSIIAHNQGLRLKDADTRLRHVIELVEQWLRINLSFPVVLCDGSNFDLRVALADRFTRSIIEYLSFENDQATVQNLVKATAKAR